MNLKQAVLLFILSIPAQSRSQQAVEEDMYTRLSASLLVGTTETTLAAAALNVHHEDNRDQLSPRTDQDCSSSSAPRSSSTNHDTASSRVESSSMHDESSPEDTARLDSLMRLVSSRRISDDQFQDGNSIADPLRETNLSQVERLLSSTSSLLTSPSKIQKDLSADLIVALHAKNNERIDAIISDLEAVVETPDAFGYTAFLHVCSRCETDDKPDRVLTFLERKEINVNWQAPTNGLTPLLALGFNYQPVLNALIERGAHALAKSISNTTIFDKLIALSKQKIKPLSDLLGLYEILLQAQDVQKLKSENPDSPELLKLISTDCWMDSLINPNQKIINAVRQNESVSDIQDLLTRDVLVTTPCLERPTWTALDYAKALGRSDVVELLEKHQRNRSPHLIEALTNTLNNDVVLRILENRDYLVDEPDKSGWRPFLHACATCSTPTRKQLVLAFLKNRKDLDVNASAHNGLTALRAVGFDGTNDILKKLIKREANALAKMHDSQATVIDDLYEHFKKTEQSNDEKLALLDILLEAQDVKSLIASKPRSPEAIKIIRKAAFKAELENNSHQRFINAIRRNESIETITRLLQPEVLITASCEDNPGMNAFLYAVSLNRFDIVKLLIHAGFPIEATMGVCYIEKVDPEPEEELQNPSILFDVDTFNLTDLTSDDAIKAHLNAYLTLSELAAHCSLDSEIDMFKQESMRHKLFVNARFKNKKTFLHLACAHGSLKLARLLVETLGAEIDLQDSYGRTPLAEAIFNKHTSFFSQGDDSHTDLARYLISHGACIRTALAALHEQAHRNRLLQLTNLNKAGTLLSAENSIEESQINNLLTQIDVAMTTEKPDYSLIAACAELVDINKPLPGTGTHLIHLALRFQDPLLLKIIAKKSEFDPNIKTKFNQTPLLLLFSVLATSDYGTYSQKFAQIALDILLKCKNLDLKQKDPWGNSAFDLALGIDTKLAETLFQHDILVTLNTLALSRTYAPEIYQKLLGWMHQENRCIGCLKAECTNLCMSCGSVYYCEQACLLSNWGKLHGQDCADFKRIASARTQVSASSQVSTSSEPSKCKHNSSNFDAIKENR